MMKKVLTPSLHRNLMGPTCLNNLITSLESRYIFDAAAIASDASMAADIAAQSEALEQIDKMMQNNTAALAPVSEQTERLAMVMVAEDAALGKTIVFVDAHLGTTEIDTLKAGLADNADMHLIRSNADALSQMAAILDGYHDVGSVHILSHGSAGVLSIGNGDVDFSALSPAQQSALQRMGAHLTDDADLLIYGCDFGAGALGKAAVDTLASFTGADIAASDDATGSTHLGANWDMEIAEGIIESDLAFNLETLDNFEITLTTLATQDFSAETTFNSFTFTSATKINSSENLRVKFWKNNNGTYSEVFETTVFKGAGHTGYANAGGDGIGSGSLNYGGAGGGGAGQEGYDSNESVGADRSDGGDGRESSITGESVIYAGGGGGAGHRSTGSGHLGEGGTGGGGDAGENDGVGGTDGLGGGGGASRNTGGSGGGGGDGVVIIAYKGTAALTIGSGLTADAVDTTKRAGYSIYRITGGTGSVSFSDNVEREVEFLSVGGGGGGAGRDTGGGGGAGEFVTGVALIGGTTATITIGTGGNGGNDTEGTRDGDPGKNTIFGTVTANGGGGAAGYESLAAANPGGSGGGGVGAGSVRGGQNTTSDLNAATYTYDTKDFTAIQADRVTLEWVSTAGDDNPTTGSLLTVGVSGDADNDGIISPTEKDGTPAPTMTVVFQDIGGVVLAVGDLKLSNLTDGDNTALSNTLATSLGKIGFSESTVATTNITTYTATISYDIFSSLLDEAGTSESLTVTVKNKDSDVASASVTTAIDLVPTLTSIVMDDTALTVGDTSLVTFTFNEVITGLSAADFTSANGTLSNFSAGSGNTWTATFTPNVDTKDTTNVISLASGYAFTDSTGNAAATGQVIDSANYTIDTVAPTVNSIVLADTALKVGDTSLVTFTFSEDVSDFVEDDIDAPNGTMSNLASIDGGTVWTATFTPSVNIEDASNMISVAATKFKNLAGNDNEAAQSSANYTIDTKLPSLNSIVLTDTALLAGDTSLVTFTFSEDVSDFVEDDIDAPNGTMSNLASIDGGTVWTATFTPSVNIEDASNMISVAATKFIDTSSNYNEASQSSANYTINTVAPTVNSIVLADTALKVGDTSLVTFTFSEDVSDFVEDDIDAPNGTMSNLASIDGGTVWTATFTPSVNIEDASNMISVAATKFKNLAGNDNEAAQSSANYTINTVAPTVNSIVLADTALKVGDTSLVTFTFSEDVSDFVEDDIDAPNGTMSNLASIDGGTVWTATFTPSVNIEDASNMISVAATKFKNLAGNDNEAAQSSANYTIDTKLPTLNSIVLTDTALLAGDTSLVTFTFSEDVSDFVEDDIDAPNGTMSNLASIDGGTVWTATFTPSVNIEDASNMISVAATKFIDTSSNYNEASQSSANYTINTVAPTVNSIVLADTALKVGDTSLVTFTFSEDVSDFVEDDIDAPNGTMSNLASIDGGTVWTATFTPSVNIEDASNMISVAATKFKNLAGNDNEAAQSSANYTIDTKLPTLNSIVLTDTALLAGDTSLVTFTFSEDVSDFVEDDIDAPNGTMSNLASIDGGTVWTATFTPSVNIEDASNMISVAATKFIDTSSNYNEASQSSANYTINTVAPTVNSIVLADTALKVGDTSLVTFTFSEDVSDFVEDDIDAPNGTMSNLASIDGGTVWTATFTPSVNIEDASNMISVAATKFKNLAGNDNEAAQSSANYTIDTKLPTLNSIVMDDTALTVGDTSLVTFTFSEDVSDFVEDDIDAPNGTMSNLASIDGGTVWTATFTPSVNIEDASNMISVAATKFIDTSSNYNEASQSSANYTIDTTAPTVTITDDHGYATSNGQKITFKIDLSEALSKDMVSSDIIVDGGTPENFTKLNATQYTILVAPYADTQTGTIKVSISSNTFTDVAGNYNVASNEKTQSYDTKLPTLNSIVLTDTALKVGDTSLVTFTFNEGISDFTKDDIDAPNGTMSDLESFNGGKFWTTTFTPSVNIKDASNMISVAATKFIDTSSNYNEASQSSANYTIDTVAPTLNSIVLTDTALLAGDTSLVTFTFSEDVSDFVEDDIDAPNGTMSNLASIDGGTVWTATFTPSVNIEDASNMISVAATKFKNLAGNDNEAAQSSANYTIDTKLPTVNSIVLADTSLVTFTFSEDVSDFVEDDIDAPNGTMSDLVTKASQDAKNITRSTLVSSTVRDATNLTRKIDAFEATAVFEDLMKSDVLGDLLKKLFDENTLVPSETVRDATNLTRKIDAFEATAVFEDLMKSDVLGDLLKKLFDENTLVPSETELTFAQLAAMSDVGLDGSFSGQLNASNRLHSTLLLAAAAA